MSSKTGIFFLCVLILAMILSACSMLPTATPAPAVSDDEMATRVAKILTEMVTPTNVLPSEELPPLPTETPQAEPQVTEAPTQVMQDTAVPTEGIPSEVPTETPTTGPTATVGIPTATATLTPIPATPTAGLTLVPSFTPPPDDPRNDLGDADWTDTMENGANWPTGPDTYTSIDFKDNKLYLTGRTSTDGWRLASAPKLNNFYLEMKVSTGTCSADDRYGFIFRVPVLHTPNQGYLFGITCDGKYSLREWDATIGDKGQMTNHVYWTSNSAIQTGSNKTNTIGLMAVGDRLILYINGVLITEVKDATFTEGYFGLFVGARQTEDFTIAVDEVNIWKDPTP